jgi:hypothetical protein
MAPLPPREFRDNFSEAIAQGTRWENKWLKSRADPIDGPCSVEGIHPNAFEKFDFL